MVETASLELCKRLSVLLPDAKTEYVYGEYWEYPGEWDLRERQWAIDHQLNIVPAWQIHELLDLLKKYGKVYISVEKEEECIVWFEDVSGYEEPPYCEDVRLVDALAKLLIWKEGGGVKE